MLVSVPVALVVGGSVLLAKGNSAGETGHKKLARSMAVRANRPIPLGQLKWYKHFAGQDSYVNAIIES
jgi:hypothetical protein